MADDEPQVLMDGAGLPDLGPALPLTWFDDIAGRAAELTEAVDAIRDYPEDSSLHPALTLNDIRFRATALLKMCHLRDIAPPAEMVTLVHRLLGLKEGSQPNAHDRKNARGFMKAASFECRQSPDASGKRPSSASQNEVAKETGVARGTIALWERDPEYWQLIGFMRSLPTR